MRAISLLIIYLLTFVASAVADYRELAADKFNLESYRGKVVYLDFWATWCAPCQVSLPFMRDLQQRFGVAGLEVVTVAVDNDPAAARELLAETNANFTAIYDPKGATLPGKFQVATMPTSFLYDQGGNLVETYRGFKESKKGEIAAKIEELLAKH